MVLKPRRFLIKVVSDGIGSAVKPLSLLASRSRALAQTCFKVDPKFLVVISADIPTHFEIYKFRRTPSAAYLYRKGSGGPYTRFQSIESLAWK